MAKSLTEPETSSMGSVAHRAGMDGNKTGCVTSQAAMPPSHEFTHAPLARHIGDRKRPNPHTFTSLRQCQKLPGYWGHFILSTWPWMTNTALCGWGRIGCPPVGWDVPASNRDRAVRCLQYTLELAKGPHTASNRVQWACVSVYMRTGM